MNENEIGIENKVLMKGPKVGTAIITFIVVLIFVICFGIFLFNKGNTNVVNEKIMLNSNLNPKSISEVINEMENINYSEISGTILQKIKEKSFLESNNINDKIKYVEINNNEYPYYFIEVENDANEDNKFTYYVGSYEDGEVVFSKMFEHKYEYELSYDKESLTLEFKAQYKGALITLFGEIVDGKFEKKDEFVEPFSDEYINTVGYILNEDEISEEEFKTEKIKYEKREFTDFVNEAIVL